MRRTWQPGPLLRWGVPVSVGIALASVEAATSMRAARGREVTLRGGTAIVAALRGSVSTERNRVGDVVELRTAMATPVTSEAVLPVGTAIYGEVTRARGGIRLAGAPTLTLRFTQLEIGGRRYAISTAPFRLRGTSDAATSAEQIVEPGTPRATLGRQIVLPAGWRIRVLLTAPVTLTLAAAR
jgi:hypothetical protein